MSGKIVFELDANAGNLAIYEFAILLSNHTNEQIDEVLKAAKNHFEEKYDCALGNSSPLFSRQAVLNAMDNEIEPLFPVGTWTSS